LYIFSNLPPFPFLLLIFALFLLPRPNGIRFIAAAGTAEFARRGQLAKGDIVSFKHHGFLLSSKKPKLPALYRKRTDITWKDVVTNWKEKKHLEGNLCSHPYFDLPPKNLIYDYQLQEGCVRGD